ncbi:MAG: hypothetical protein V2J51_03560 [Erythrobacter sp.]|jgi:hypothetical protein|nr:hypothetical protein [Erythrobacter sp.]
MTDVAIFDAMAAIEAAENRDLEPIIKRLEAGESLPEEREWLARYLRGEKSFKRGRPPASQAGHNAIKKGFDDNRDIDLAAWDALQFLMQWENKTESEAKKEIAAILGETAKNTGDRLNRVKAHLASGKRRSEYVTSNQKIIELFAELSESMGAAGISPSFEALRAAMGLPKPEQSPPPLPLLVRLGRKLNPAI